MTRFLGSGRVGVAVVVFTASAVLVCIATADALRLDPLPAAERAIAVGSNTTIARPEETPDSLLDDAVANDPFQATREAPATRYGAVAIPVTVQDASGSSIKRPETIRLLGTVVDRNGASFALCQVEGATVKMVHTGQQIGTYKLRSITPGSAVFEGEDGAHLELKVSRSSN